MIGVKKMRKKTIMGQLLTDFRFKRNEARKDAEKKLWDNNKLGNPKRRGGHEVREHSFNQADGTQVIELSLWKKVDSIAVKVSVDTKAEEITTQQAESIEELMK